MNLRRFFHRTRADQDHAREFQSHLEMETADNIARGMSPDEALRAAQRKFGNATVLREHVYQNNSLPVVEAVARDVRYAIRVLLASRTFTLVSLLTLTLGMGAAAAIFTVVNSVILRPLPYPKPERLVTVWETNPSYHLPGQPPETVSFSPGNYLDLRDQTQDFEQVGAFATTSYNLTGGAVPDHVAGGLVSAGLFRALDIRPALGRLFLPSDDTPAADRVAILSHALWMDRFGGKPNVIGTTLRLDDNSHVIVGVLPAGFHLMNSDVDIWLPIERKIAPESMHWRHSYYVRVIGRLKPGVTIERARQDADRVVKAIRRQFPDSIGRGALVVPLLDNTVARARGPLWILLGAAGFVLLIACVNIAHLNLGRSMTRRREIALRLALGAGRGRLLRQLLAESLVLAVAGAAAGLLFAEWSIRVLLRLAPAVIPRATEVQMDAYVVGFAVLIAGSAALLFGLLPALGATRADLQEALKSGARSLGGDRGQRSRNLLAISEIALALVLMIGAGLMVESFRRVSAVSPGFDPHGLITMRVAPSPTRSESLDAQNALYEGVLERLRGIPGLKSVSAVDGMPFTDGGFDNAFSIDGRPAQPGSDLMQADIRRIDSAYFETMGIPLLSGRLFTRLDRTETPPVVIINERMARRYWPAETAVGKRLTIFFGPPGGIHAQIVGVVADVRSALDSFPADYIYMPYTQGRHVASMDLVLRTDPHTPLSAGSLGRAVRAAASAVDPDLPVYRIHTVEEIMSVSLATRAFEMLLLAVFAGFAACLSAVGLYGVLAYSVQARTSEIGIRTALGANPRRVFGQVLGEAAKLMSLGLAVGIAAALVLTRLLSGLLFGIHSTDLPTFAGVSLLLVLIALAAACIPASRAARVDPIVALRHE